MRTATQRQALIRQVREDRRLDEPTHPPSPRPRRSARVDAPQLLPCLHRGESIDKTPCRSCEKSPRLHVFECAVHGRCTLKKQGDAGDAVCDTCVDRALEPASIPFASFRDRHAGKTAVVVGRGETTFHWPDLAHVDGPVFFINAKVAMERHVRHDNVYFFALDHEHSHWLRQTQEHHPVRSLPVLLEGPDWGRPGRPRRVQGARRVCWFAQNTFTDPMLALEQTPEQLALSRELYRARGTIQPLLHFAWFCGVRHVRLIGCDGINDPNRVYDKTDADAGGRVSGKKPGMIYDAIRKRADLVMKTLGIQAEYLGTPTLGEA